MAAPIIGVTTFQSKPPHKPFHYHSVSELYIQALVKSGGIPVLIPLGLPDESLKKVRQKLDGIVFTGGGDLEPALYGGEDYPYLENVDPERDRTEIHLVRDTIQTGLPFLGICRGLQTINVALGGSLYVDIRHENPRALKHNCFSVAPREELIHPIEITPGSLLNNIMNGTAKRVNSGHHQAAKKLGDGLVVNAVAPDGIVEGCELPGYPFGLAVQWHPEFLTHHPEMMALFQAFVSAAGQAG